MQFVRRLISINTLILLASFMFMFAFYGQMKEAYYDKKKLLEHINIIKTKTIKIEHEGEKNRDILYLTLNDNKEYKVSKYVNYADRILFIGDTVKLLTKQYVYTFGNFISSENGNSIWTSKNINEVYELYSFKDKILIFEFEQHKNNLKKMFWAFPLASLLFFGWFLYRRSGIKSPFIIQSDD